MTKTNPGNFFEDFTLGQVIDHATPRTVTDGDRAVYGAIYPTRFALPSSSEFAAASGLSNAPIEELIGFHVAFGKTVPDVSLNAVANLGYAECRFHRPVLTGDTLRTNALGSLAIRFSDNTLVRMARETVLRVRKIDGASNSELNLEGGTIWGRAERGGSGWFQPGSPRHRSAWPVRRVQRRTINQNGPSR